MSRGAPLLVVDSSVVFKWFCDRQESHVDDALALLEAHGSGGMTLASPAHMPSEVLNALRYTGLAEDYLKRVPDALIGAEIVTVPLDAGLLQTALDLALAHNLTIHDALFPALAAELDCELVTADRAQARVTACPVRLYV